MAYGCMLYELTGISVKKLVIIMSCENGECVVYEEYDKTRNTSNYSENTLVSLFKINWRSMEPNKELEKRKFEKKFLTPQKFAIEIEKIVAEEEFNYIDAICHYCKVTILR